MKSSTILSFLFAAILAVFATGCNTSDGNHGPGTLPSNVVYDFATLESTTQNGSVFTLNKADDSETVTYTSTTTFVNDKRVKIGDRLVIAYTTLDGRKPYQSGAINLLGYIMLNNTTFKVTDLEGPWGSSPVRMDVITRTGTYINMQLKVYARNNMSQGELRLVADPNKLDVPVPELFLVFDNDKNSGDNEYIAYASFNIADIWTRQTCRGVKITYQTPDGIKSKTFENNDVITPMPIE